MIVRVSDGECVKYSRQRADIGASMKFAYSNEQLLDFALITASDRQMIDKMHLSTMRRAG
jgi:hypothetical protein